MRKSAFVGDECVARDVGGKGGFVESDGYAMLGPALVDTLCVLGQVRKTP